MVDGWKEMVRTHLRAPNEFVSADARRLSKDPRTYEMLGSAAGPQLKTPERAVISPYSTTDTSFSPEQDSKTEYFDKPRAYVIPISSYSSPRPPSSSAAREWDPRATHARGVTLPGVAISKDYGV